MHFFHLELLIFASFPLNSLQSNNEFQSMLWFFLSWSLALKCCFRQQIYFYSTVNSRCFIFSPDVWHNSIHISHCVCIIFHIQLVRLDIATARNSTQCAGSKHLWWRPGRRHLAEIIPLNYGSNYHLLISGLPISLPLNYIEGNFRMIRDPCKHSLPVHQVFNAVWEKLNSLNKT